MTTQRDLERALDDFFVAGVDEVADRVIDDALLTIDHTPQRRAMRVPWRFPIMSSSLKLATTAVAVVLAVGALSAFVLANRTGGSGTTPPPSVSAAPSTTPLPSPSSSPSNAPSVSATPPSTAGWVTFTSSRYGYQIAHPPTWTVTPATRNWALATDRMEWKTTAADHFTDQATPAASTVLITSFAVDVPAGMTEDQWLLNYYKTDSGSCIPSLSALVPTTIDGHPGRIGTSTCADTQAFVFIGDRVHVFAVWLEGQEQLLQAFVSTVKFEATTPSGSPGASASPG